MSQEFIITLLNLVGTPLLVLLTLWVKNNLARGDKMENRYDKQQDDLLQALEERVTTCEQRHGQREVEIKEIRVELKNRDEEYLNLYKEHTTLKARYEVLVVDHGKLKKDYDTTAMELEMLKDDIKKKAQLAADGMQLAADKMQSL